VDQEVNKNHYGNEIDQNTKQGRLEEERPFLLIDDALCTSETGWLAPIPFVLFFVKPSETMR